MRPTRSNIGYDNGWNFFAGDWAPLGACCWNAVRFHRRSGTRPGAVTRRELVYLDVNLPVSVVSANANGERLATTMPAYVEYLASLPSVHDLYRHAPAAPDGMPVVYDDAGVTVTGGPAYVFRPSNQENLFEPVDPAALQ